MSLVHVMGYAVSQGGPDRGTALGPLVLQHVLPESLKKHWIDTLYPREETTGKEALANIADVTNRLAMHCKASIENKAQVLVLGGDHTQAIGTWSGVQAGLKKPLGLIWIDAHMDAHDPETTPSQNIHGMPVAVLLGDGPAELTHIMHDKPKIQPNHLILIGVRSFEPEEHQRLIDQGVRIYFMDEIKEKGISTVLKEAHDTLNKTVDHIGISLDLDVMDPIKSPGVSVPEPDGLDPDALIQGLTEIVKDNPHICALELTEFNPILDQENKTQHIVKKLLDALYA